MIDAVHRSGCEPVAMESYGADTRPPLERCLHDVRTCEVYVGIVAWRYGSCPPGKSKSFTHLEYEEAVQHGKQILLFHLDENAVWPVIHVDESQQRVKELRNLQQKGHVVQKFRTLGKLADEVGRGLHELYGAVGALVPELLPYTVDRHAQKESLAAAVERGELDRSPSLVVLYGAADQSQGKFVEYMKEQLLTRYLGVKAIDKFSVSLRASEFDQPEVITQRIAEACHLALTVEIDTLARRLYDSESITMLRFPVEMPIRHGRLQVWQIARLADYFARWPHDRSLRVLPIISVQYGEAPGWRGLLSRRVAGSPNRFGQAIEHAVATAAADCRIVVLPELTNVEHMEAMVWADQAEVHRRLGGRDPAPTIRRVFQKYERSSRKRGMPMDKLATELTLLLSQPSPLQEVE